jgi:hypothetical protein
VTRSWLFAAFALTRLGLAVAALAASGVYDRVETDTNLYAQYAQQLAGGAVPYRDVDIEYPPVLLPFLVAPALALPAGAYRAGWVALMLAVDAAGLAGALRLDRRLGGSAGWWWVVLIALLGPLVYTRYDLLPAVATVWALERARAGREAGAGAWLAVGALAKLWPGLLAPAFLVVARRPWRVIAGGAVAAALVLAPLAGVLPDIAGDVLGYHSARGIQIESVWANALLLAHRLAGYPIEVVRDFGAAHVGSPLSATMKACSTALSLAAVAAAALRARRLGPGGLPALAFALLAVLVATGSVLSPQFLIWVIALAAASQADPASPVRTAVRWLVPTAAVNHVLYPTFYPALVRRFDWSAIGVLSVRNLLLLMVAGTAVAGVARVRAPAPVQPRVLEPV